MSFRNYFGIIILLFLLAIGLNAENCIEKPEDETCKDYKLPGVENDIKMMCSSDTGMPNMPGCTVDNLCHKIKSDPFCAPFSILKDLCEDMGGMKGCKNYTSMCRSGTVVKECSTKSLLLPSSGEAQVLIGDICTEMRMEDCDKCKIVNNKATNCDFLTVYSRLCMSMPDMKQCASWRGFCHQIPNWPICSGTSGDFPPAMRMYFHLGFADYVLFEQWVPRTVSQYIGTWIACFFMAVLNEILKMYRARLEKHWNFILNQKKNEEEEQPLLPNMTYSPFRLGIDLPRACLHFIEVGWGLLVMLVAMTYNVGLFLSLLCGAFFGTLMFGRFYNYEPKASCH